MALSLPAFAHRVTVFGSTRNIDATSAGVSKGSGSCVRDAIRSLLHICLKTRTGVPTGQRVSMVRLVPDVRHGPNGWSYIDGWTMNDRFFTILGDTSCLIWANSRVP